MAYSILIVDDDRTFVEELKSALQWNRLRITEVYTAFSVREAIAFLSKTKADIVLCDIEMPGGNGLQLLKWIRENHASMECIVLSSYAEFSYAQSALRFDVCDYLLKPIKAKELEETISRVVGLLDARRGWQEEPLETLWAALFDGAVKQADFTRQAQKHGLTENSSLAILLLRFVPVPGQPVPSHYGRPLVRQAILDLADQNALQTVVRLSETRWILVCRAAGKDPFPRAPLAAFLDAVEARIGLQVCAYCGEKGTVGQAVSMWEALSQLEKLIRSNRGEETLAALGRMYAEISRCEGTSPEYLRHLYCQIIFLFLHEAESHNVRAVTERTDFLLYTAVRQETLAGLWDILRRTAQDYFSALNPSCPDIAVRVENYIEAHYRNCGLTVQSIAGELGFTNSYLCAAYKKSCGKTVNQRLTEIRLHHAKELLAGTSRRLYEIANAVGYGDGKYFVKLFTREVGLSPREYRGRHSYEE